MITDERSCVRARTELSTRLDGELADEGWLRAHLAGCAACRAHEGSLETLTTAFAALRRPEPHADLWPRIEGALAPASDAPARLRPALARAAAGLVGFLGLGAATGWLAPRAPAATPGHALVRLAGSDPSHPDHLLGALPEYRLLRALPHSPSTEDDR